MTQVLETCAEAQAELESTPETAEQNCSISHTKSHAECERNEAESAQVEIHSARYTYKELGQKFSVSADAIRKDMAKIVETFESCGVEPAFLEREGRRVYVTEEGLEALSAHRSDSEYLDRVRQSLTPKEPSTPAPANNPLQVARLHADPRAALPRIRLTHGQYISRLRMGVNLYKYVSFG